MSSTIFSIMIKRDLTMGLLISCMLHVTHARIAKNQIEAKGD